MGVIRWRGVVCLLAAGLLAACAAPLGRDAIGPNANESIIVLGVPSPNYRVSVYPGKIVEGKFIQSQTRGAVVAGQAPGGYLVARASAGDVLAVSRIVAVDKPEDADDHLSAGTMT